MKLITKITFLFLLPIQLLASNHWHQKANFGGQARHRCTAFTIGEKGYIGMGHINSAEHIIYKDVWEYDPATNSWTQKADFGGGLRYQCAAFSIDGVAYMGTGRNELDTYEKDFWKFNPLSNMWSPISDFPGQERRGASGFTINNKGYVGLGQATSGYASDFWEYDPNTDTWREMAEFIGLPRTSAVSFVHNEKAYVGTGHTYSAALKDFYEFTPSSNTWVQKADVGDTLRQDATGFQINGDGYIGTGNNVDGSVNYKDFLKYNFEADTWTQVNDFTGSARRYMVSFTINNIAYCGTGTNGTNLKDFWSFNPTLSSIEHEINKLETSIYPNPSNDNISFMLQNENHELITLQTFDLNGKLIQQLNTNGNYFEVSGQNYKPGIYFYSITKNNQHTSGKITFINE